MGGGASVPGASARRSAAAAAAAARATDSNEEIRLLSLNIFLRWSWLIRGEYQQQRAKHFCRNVLGGYDIVCLQECFGKYSNSRALIMQQARAQGYEGVASTITHTTGGKFVDGGLTILSRLPVEHSDFEEFKHSRHDDFFAARRASGSSERVERVGGGRLARARVG